MTGSVCRKRVRVLVVDDNPLVRDMLGDVVRVAGYDVTVSAEGVEAVTRLTEERYDVLLTDIKMPTMDGWELIALATQIHPMLAIVVITGEDDPQDRQRAEQLGVTLIRKPFALGTLQTTLQTVLASQSW
jgi:CheY-like chemotaxis protein